MKQKFFIVSAALTALICLTMTAFAATYTVRVTNYSKLEILQNGYAAYSFQLDNGNVSVDVGRNGGMNLSFRERRKSANTTVAFSGLTELDFTGSYSSLAFGSGLGSKYEFTLRGASVSAMTVSGTPKIKLKNGSRVSSLAATSQSVKVSCDSTSRISSSNLRINGNGSSSGSGYQAPPVSSQRPNQAKPGGRYPVTGWETGSAIQNRSISVRIPSFINGNYQVNIYCNGTLIQRISLSRSDAGRTKTYTVKVKNGGRLTAEIVKRR